MRTIATVCGRTRDFLSFSRYASNAIRHSHSHSPAALHRPAADHVRPVRLVKLAKNYSWDPCIWRMGHGHTIPARRMEAPAAMVGALFVALIAFCRTLLRTTPSRYRYKPDADQLSIHFFPYSLFYFYLCNLSLAHYGLARFIACSRLPIFSKPIWMTLGSFHLPSPTRVFTSTGRILPTRYSRSSRAILPRHMRSSGRCIIFNWRL
jgi:hypothetical protein